MNLQEGLFPLTAKNLRRVSKRVLDEDENDAGRLALGQFMQELRHVALDNAKQHIREAIIHHAPFEWRDYINAELAVLGFTNTWEIRSGKWACIVKW